MVEVIKKSVTNWNCSLDLNFKELLISIFKSGCSAACGNVDGVTTNLVDAVGAIGISRNGPSWREETWHLIVSSLAMAYEKLVMDNLDLLPEEYAPKKREIDRALKQFEDTEISIKSDFRNNPKEIGIVSPAQSLLQKMLELSNIDSSAAKNIADRLPDEFVLELQLNWKDNASKYTCVREALDTPFDSAALKVEQWDTYLAHLKTLSQNRVFDASFGLDKLYIPLRGFSTNRSLAPSRKIVTNQVIVYDLHTYVSDWLKKSGQLLFIKGGPGCGKSSFAKVLCGELASQNIKTIFVQLQHFNIERNFSQALDDYLDLQGWFKKGSDVLKDNVVLVLDGLDEISESGNHGSTAASDFMEYLLKVHNNLKDIKTIITGRSIAVESVEKRYSEEGGTINILGYHINKENRYKFHNRNDKIVQKDQRKEWWTKYNNLLGKGDEIPRFVEYKSLYDITTQPLLNYLLALAANTELEITTQTNINILYEHLLNEVANKNFTVKKYKDVDIDENDFQLLLEEIAICAWHGGEVRRTTWKKIASRCRNIHNLNIVTDSFEKCGRQSHTKLLVSFYFGSAGLDSSGDKAFEFTHKSFGEYLAARRIVKELNKFKKLNEYHSPKDFFNNWVSMFGPAPIDQDLAAFVIREIELLPKEEVLEWQEMLTRRINYLLAESFPKTSVDRQDFQKMKIYARNAEESLLVLLNAFASRSKKILKINWPNEISFGELIRRIQGQRKGPNNCTAFDHLSYLDISGQRIDMIDLYDAKCFYGNFDHVDAHFSILHFGDFSKSSFIKSTLSWSNIGLANFAGANLTHADLRSVMAKRAIFNSANLKSINAPDSNMIFSNFSKADLTEANFDSSKLSGSKFTSAKCKFSKFVDADLRYADFSHANLEGADFTNANLEGAILIGAKIQGAIFNGANRSNINPDVTQFEEGIRQMERQDRRFDRPRGNSSSDCD